jgi:membrane bound O-acyltransferase family protein
VSAAQAYVPTSLGAGAGIAGLLVGTLGAGFFLSRLQGWVGRVSAWGLVLTSVIAAHVLTLGEGAGVRMLALIGAGLWGLKAVVLHEERRRGLPAAGLGQWLAFASWPGMRASLFVRGPRELEGGGALLRRGALRLALGVALVAGAWASWGAWGSRVGSTALLLLGLSLVLHFGICNLMAGFWRTRGVACRALFQAPLLAESLNEFWSRRWNLAFSEMTATAVYRPLSVPWGRAPALVAAFVFSGLLHELAISVPVQAGFGLPLAYFALHGGLCWLERVLAARGRGIGGWVGRLWTVGWLVAPLPILFHPPFLRGVAWPLIGM